MITRSIKTVQSHDSEFLYQPIRNQYNDVYRWMVIIYVLDLKLTDWTRCLMWAVLNFFAVGLGKLWLTGSTGVLSFAYVLRKKYDPHYSLSGFKAKFWQVFMIWISAWIRPWTNLRLKINFLISKIKITYWEFVN